jgi:hypothetical protein
MLQRNAASAHRKSVILSRCALCSGKRISHNGAGTG